MGHGRSEGPPKRFFVSWARRVGWAWTPEGVQTSRQWKMIWAPLTKQIWIFGILNLFSDFLGPKTLPNCPDQIFLSRQSQANPFFTDPSPFPPNLNFFEVPIFCPNLLPLRFSVFRGPGSVLKRYSQSQPSEGSFFSKKRLQVALETAESEIQYLGLQELPDLH